MTINDRMAALVAELVEGEVPDPLHQRFALAAIWADLARLAGEPLPLVAAAVMGAALDVTCDPLTSLLRGAFTDYAREPVHAD